LARYIGPVCRQCRREGMKLYLKGERCHSEKCAIERRNFIPGQHGKDRAKKIVGYGLQLREKQKVRRVYGVLERQFRSTFEKAALAKGITGENLMSALERRLDSVVYRMGFGTSRAQSRQIVRHGHIDVNGRKCNIPSAQVKVGDVISVRQKSKNHPTILAARDATAHAPAPNWIDVDREGLTGRVTSLPLRSELVQIQLNEQLIVELYSK
jgi:small subunit ribosomal protein S4